MAIVSVPVPPRKVATTVQVWICRLCGNGAARYGDVSTAERDANEHVAAIGWAYLVDGDIVCDRCKILPGIAKAVTATNAIIR